MKAAPRRLGERGALTLRAPRKNFRKFLQIPSKEFVA
jgi:hypothetical protein